MGRHATGSYSVDTSGNAVVRHTVRKGVRVSVQLHRPPDDVVTKPLGEYVGVQARALFGSGDLTRDELGTALSTACAKLREVRTVKQLDTAWADVLKRGLILAEVRPSTTPTFREVAERWLSGEVKREFPGFKMRKAKTAAQARKRLEQNAYDLIGHVPIDKVYGKHLTDVYNATPGREQTRVNVWDICRRVISIAHKPLRLITADPIGNDDRPRVEQHRQHAALEPQDDLDLMRCTDVSLHDRIWYGFLAREGSRVEELGSLKRSALSDTMPTLSVWLHKVNRLARWNPDPSTVEALRLYHALLDTPRDGRMFNPTRNKADHYRNCLETAGVRKRRPELWQHDDNVRRAQRHDLRALFVTMSLADERSDTYIRERTGHRSERMTELYNRDAELYRDAGYRKLTPLVEAIPELAALARGELVERPSAVKRPRRRANKGVVVWHTPERQAQYAATRKAREAAGIYTRTRTPAYQRAYRRARYERELAARLLAAQNITANNASDDNGKRSKQRKNKSQTSEAAE